MMATQVSLFAPVAPVEVAPVMADDGRPARATHDGLPVYEIPAPNIERLRERVAKMSRRAVRLHMEPLSLVEFGEGLRTWTECITDAGGYTHRVERSVRLVLVTVAGTLPRVNGWSMAATIQHGTAADGGAGNILRTGPGTPEGGSLPARFRGVYPICEHCRMDRRRNDTYVLVSDGGEYKQVGRSCLADFLRTGDAAGWAEMAEMLAGLREECEGFEELGGEGAGMVLLPIEGLLAQVACILRQDGWCSRTEARNSFEPRTATVDAALEFFDRRALEHMGSAKREKYTVTEADTARAVAAIEWANGLAADVTNDYLWNVRTVAARVFIGEREAGIAGSIIAAYGRAMEQELRRKYERETVCDEWFGTPGKREVWTLTVTGSREIEGTYGLTTLVKFRDAEGRMAAWFCSGEAPEWMTLDATVTVKATVKKHETFRELRQTTLTRVALVKIA